MSAGAGIDTRVGANVSERAVSSTLRTVGFAAALKAEVMKGRRAAPRKIALFAPLPFCMLGMLAGGVGGGDAIGAFSTYGWAYWYTLMLPIAIALITASIARIDTHHHLRSVLGLPVLPAHTWWAKVVYALALTLGANGVVLVASVVTHALGAASPGLVASLIVAVLLLVTSAWMVPVGLFLTTRFGTLAGIAIPAVLQVGVGLVLWSSSFWYLVPSATAFCVASPFVGVQPSGVPLAPGDPLGVFGWESVVGIAVTVVLFVLLAVLGARWFAKQEAK